MSAVARLRYVMRPAHERVDTTFSQYDLTDRNSYVRFLTAHARALPAAEAALANFPDLPGWRERQSLSIADLFDLGEPAPMPLDFTLPDRPSAVWGALYVIEGSRLGGVMLARGVAPGLPNRYLAARHLSGEWRALMSSRKR